MEQNQAPGIAAAAEAVEAQTEPPKGKRTRAKAKTPEPPPAQVTEVKVEFNVPPEQLEAALGAFLSQMSKRTKTAPPDPKEVKALGQSLAFGLQHTKIGISDKSGPWVPFGIMVASYVIPRALERIMAATGQEEAPKGTTFPRRLGEGGPGATVPVQPPAVVDPAATAGQMEDSTGPVEAVGVAHEGP